MKKSIFKTILQKLFKKIFYQLFKIKHGKISFVEAGQSDLFKEDLVFLKNRNESIKYSIFTCPNARLYTDRIQDTAVIKNNILLNKPSFQLRDNMFDLNIEKNVVLKNGTPYMQKKLNGTVLSLLTGGGGNNNFFHWLFDVLPRMAIVEKKINLDKINYFLCPNLNKWQMQTLELLGINKKRCLSRRVEN